MSKNKVYTVSELSKLAGISIRTLHYYDEIGLLKPHRRQDNGFREYNHQDVLMLQQILLYRELDFSIDTIRENLTREGYDLLKSFEEQKSILEQRINKARIMISSIEDSIKNISGKLNSEILFGDIPKEKVEHWDKIRKSQGEQPVSESMQFNSQQFSEHQANEISDESSLWFAEYSKLTDLPIESIPVQEAVLSHYKSTNRALYCVHKEFKGIGYEGYKSLAFQMLDDQVLNEMHEHYGQGLAKHLHQAMLYFSEQTLKDNFEELRKND